MAVNPHVFIVGTDRSTNLVKIATQHRPHGTAVADALDLPHPLRKFDFAISIAVIHHLSTPERRIDAARAVLETLRGNGRALIYVWALEQKDSRRGWDEGHEQDVMVPWVMRQKGKKKPTSGDSENENAEPSGDRTFHRYYHLYRKGELEQNIEAAGGRLLEAGYEKDNWWAIAQRAFDK